MGPWSVDQIPDPHWHGECECATGDGRTEFRTISRKAARLTNTLRPDRNVVRAQVSAHTNHTRRLVQPSYARVRAETVGTQIAKSIKGPGCARVTTIDLSTS